MTERPAHRMPLPLPWGLQSAPREALAARRIERRWRWPLVALLGATIPAFYAQLLQIGPAPWASAIYGLAAVGLLLALAHTAVRCPQPASHLRRNGLELVLAVGLIAAATLPPSNQSTSALALRLAVAFLTLARMVWGLQHLILRGSLAYLLLSAGAVLVMCGAGFWWLEPSTPNLSDGLWLAFTTASTVGFGDVAPTTPAAKIFSVFVVMLGYGVLSLVTAAIATRWVETEERAIEREIMRDMHRRLADLREDIGALRSALAEAGVVTRPSSQPAHQAAAPAGAAPMASASAVASGLPRTPETGASGAAKDGAPSPKVGR